MIATSGHHIVVFTSNVCSVVIEENNMMVAGMVSGQEELQGTKQTPLVSQFLLGSPRKDCMAPSYGL